MLLQGLGQKARGHTRAGARCGHVVHHRRAAKAAHAAQRNTALTVLYRVYGVGCGQGGSGLGNGAKLGRNFGFNSGLIEAASNDQRGVVGPVMFTIEGIQ